MFQWKNSAGTYRAGFTLQDDTGAAVNADSTPTGAVYKNGAYYSSATVTVSEVATGSYTATCPLSGFSIGNDCEILITYTVAGITATLWTDVLTVMPVTAANANNVNVTSLSAALQALLGGRWAINTATTTPATADFYVVGGFYPASGANETVYYVSTTLGTPMYIWNNGSGFTLSGTLGTNGASYWTSTTLGGVWTQAGSATGTPVFSVHGATVLSGFQPEAVNFSAGMQINNPTSGVGLSITGSFGGPGIEVTGGLSGPAVQLNAGSSSGQGILITTTSGDAIKLNPTGGRAINGITGGIAGVDWSELLNPTATVGLTSTTINSSQAVNAADIGGISAAGLLSAAGEGSSLFFTHAPSGGGSGGSGPIPFTVTVTDPSSNPIQNALVSLTQGGIVYWGATNVSGQVSFSLSAVTYVVAIIAPGFTFTPVSLVVTTTGSIAYALTLAVPPSSVTPPTCLAYLTTLDGTGAIESGVQIQFQFVSDDAAAGISTDTSIITATSVGTSPNNLAQQLRQNSTYQARRGSQITWVKFTTGNSSTFQIPEIIGQP
jgi:hypothetical protein